MSISQKTQAEADSIVANLKELERVADYEWVQAFSDTFSFSVPLARMLNHPGLYIRTLESEGRYAISEAAYQLQVVLGVAKRNVEVQAGLNEPYRGVREAMSIAYHDWRAYEQAEFLGITLTMYRGMTEDEIAKRLVAARKAVSEHADVSDELIASMVKEGRDAR